MNQPPEHFVHVQEERLLAFAIACFERVGLTPEQAAVTSRLLVNSDLKGAAVYRAHGFDGLPFVLAHDFAMNAPGLHHVFSALGCVRASRDVDGKSVFALTGRGIAKHLTVNAESGRLADTDFAATDLAARICPVGVILPKGRGFAVPIGARPYDTGTIRDTAQED